MIVTSKNAVTLKVKFTITMTIRVKVTFTITVTVTETANFTINHKTDSFDESHKVVDS